MFEQRCRVVLGVIVVACLVLLGRAAHVQVVQAAQWREVASDTLRRTTLTEAPRGRLLDRRGEVLAEDVPCNDAAVAFWFVSDPPDEAWMRRLARDLARQTEGYYQADTAEQIRRVGAAAGDAEEALSEFWGTLADLGGVSGNEVAARRRTTIERIEARRGDVVARRHRVAVRRHAEGDAPSWWRRWLLGDMDLPPEESAFEEPIADERQAHVVLRDLSNDQYNALVKFQSDLPPTLADALVLRASSTRRYPAGPAASHLVGRVAQVTPGHIEADPSRGEERRRYLPGDLAGHAGLEAFAEKDLRGTRGVIDHDIERDARSVAFVPEAGRDVAATVDVALSRDVRAAFERVDFRWAERTPGEPAASRTTTGFAPGAAVVIEVATGEVLALVSVPDFDANDYVRLADDLYADEVSRPLLDRTTRYAAVPGSTVKPIVGLGAIKDGLVGACDTIECTGYLIVDVNGRRTRYSDTGRCWTARMYGHLPEIQGHQNPPDAHPTPLLNPPHVSVRPGHLSLADAIQRSCNVWFETLGHRGGTQALSRWLGDFGLGRVTGVGLAERRGLVPSDRPVTPNPDDPMAEIRETWFGAMGQGSVEATPLQMADVAATLARDGVRLPPTLRKDDLRERIDLGFDRDALDLVRRGMKAVVHTRGGSAHALDARLPVQIGAKTGSAQAPPLTVTRRDPQGRPMTDFDTGRPLYDRLLDTTTRDREGVTPWYRATNNAEASGRPELTHSWFIGYAPADEPRYAFAVFVEYGGSGGVAAGSVAAQVVQALVAHDYLEPTREPDPSRPGYFVLP